MPSTPEFPAPPDPGCCPVCGQPNQCAMELARQTGAASTEPCWCTQVNFSAELLARVPAQAQGLACICARCARAAQASE
ncbi:MAG: hypothetical protein C0445_07655 [Polaromonas sp.]|nr:hypothetical protein [Polaromonas sp.]